MEGGVIYVIGIKIMAVKLMGIEGENFLHVDFFYIFVGIFGYKAHNRDRKYR